MKREVFSLFAFIILVLCMAHAQKISVRAGYITRASLYAEAPTFRWGGVIGYITSGNLNESAAPLTTHSIGSGRIDLINVSASNLLDGRHYLAALPQVPGAIDSNYQINVLLIKNITEEDLEEWGVFNASNFPVFHPNYYQHSDNPKVTFCCYNETILISQIPFQPYVIWLKQKVKYYLLKYKYNETLSLPIFLVNLSTYTCYNSSSCNFEFMLPAKKTYNFYVLPKYPVYEMKVWIDGVETTNFQYADLPYNVTIYVSEKYTHKSVPNALVGIREIDGNLMFIPQIVVGATTEGYVLAPTDQNGYASFLIVPTKYASPPTYRIEAIIVNLSEVLLSKSLTISDIGSNIIKQVSPSELQQKTMDKIQDAITVINSLKEWMDENKCFNSYTITVQTDGTYSVSPSPFVLKTGAPNFLKVYLSTPTGTPVSGKVEIGEFNGILLLHPTNATVSFDSTEWEKTFKHIERDISTGEEFVVVPTSYGSADSTITLKIYDANNMLVKEISASIEREVSLPSGSPCSISQTMMDRVSNIKWVINNLRYALGG